MNKLPCRLSKVNSCRVMCFVLLSFFLLPGSLAKLSSHASSPTPFDTYGNLCWGDEQERLDNFAGHLDKSPASVAYIIVYAGRHSCAGEAKYRAERAKKWLTKRGVRSDRIFTRDGGYREKVETVLFVNDKEAAQPERHPTLNKEQVSIKRRCVDKTFAQVICLQP